MVLLAIVAAAVISRVPLRVSFLPSVMLNAPALTVPPISASISVPSVVAVIVPLLVTVPPVFTLSVPMVKLAVLLVSAAETSIVPCR